MERFIFHFGGKKINFMKEKNTNKIYDIAVKRIYENCIENAFKISTLMTHKNVVR